MSVSAITSAISPTAVWQPPVPVGPALPTANTTAAPTPFAALQKGHQGHHHHHHGGAPASPPASAPASATTGVASGSGTTTGSILNASA